MHLIIRPSLLISLALAALFISLAFNQHFISRPQTEITVSEDYYIGQWKKVEDALGKGLPKSALDIVRQIYARARTDKNTPQIIKATAYRVALLAQTNEEGEVILVRDITSEMNASQHPAKAIFESMLADLYWNYYQSNRWRIHQRTQVEDTARADFRTWDASKFFNTVRVLYLKSVEPASELQKNTVKDYEEILIERNESEKYRPTLYDILAHRALDFFIRDETDLPKPTKEFELTGLDALKPTKEFVAHRFETPDESDLKYNALLLYQQLMSFHLNDKTPDALVDLDLARLKLARSKTHRADDEDKDTTYRQALIDLEKQYHDASISSQIEYEIASYYFEKGEYIRAKEMCDRGQEHFPGSRGAVNCEALKSQILRKEINLSLEQTVLPDAPFIMSVAYRNIDKVYCRIIESDEEQPDEYDYSRRQSVEEWLKEVLRKKSLQSWQQNLAVVKDYKSHRTDVKGPVLSTGHYLFLMSAKENFSLEGNAIQYARVTATRLSLQSQQHQDGSMVCRVNDAENGKPLEGVTVNLYSRRWASGGNKYVRGLINTLSTDKNGSFTLMPGNYNDGLYVTLKLKNDVYAVGQSFYPSKRYKSGEHYRTLFFTDRNLYRPGQTIYFKGIILKENPDEVKYATAPKVTTTVGFYDANNQKISERAFMSNEYGSFNGSFTAPTGVLTGMMTIRDSWGSQTIRVEEYKRPKFEVQFQPIKGSFSLGDMIKTKGTAKAYAGANIDGAQVKYRVVRNAHFPYWYWWWRPMPDHAEKEIAQGSVRTNENGEFEIDFTAVPDKSIPKKELPVFTYTISADVTDVNGETRSGSTSVSIGYTALSLSIRVDEMIETSEKSAITITSQNLSGEALKTSGTLLIEKLQTPKRIIRNRFLAKADQYKLTHEEFIKAFPHDEYKDENNPDTWSIERTAMNTTFSTDAKGLDSIQINDLAQGRYRITVKAKDPTGEEILLKRFFTVYNISAKSLPLTSASMQIPLKINCQPGEIASFIWGTSYSDAKVLYQIEHRGEIIKEEWLTFNNEQRRFELSIKEEYRGGVSVHISMVRAYRLYTENIYINVPWTNKQLRIETATFRDKLKPGQEEEWRITIKGEKAGRVAAEMVATMYDASLDAIWSGYWNTFAWPTFYSSARVGEYTFGALNAQAWVRGWSDTKSGYYQGYDELNMFILPRGRYSYGGREYRSLRKADGKNGAEELMMAVTVPLEAARGSQGEMAKDRKGEEAKQVTASPGQVEDIAQIKTRKNFNETAFFFPQLMTNDSGDVVLKFTAPESLTRWRMIAFAHTPDLKVGSLEKTTVTQKELMVMPNAPRFLREGDEIIFPIKINNMSDKSLSGTAKLMLFDAVTMQPIDVQFKVKDAEQKFSVEKDRSTNISWKLSIPDGVSAIVYRVVAKAGEFSDGEEAPLPILPNRMLVTESLPLNVRGNQTRTYTFEKLLNSSSSSTLKHYKLSLEMTSNPAWYAVQALPYMMEFPYECSEQIFNRFYANSIASHLVNSNPKIKRVFEQWKGADALLSNLQKNQELKSLLLQETPWVMQGQNESERKKRIALLFDLNTMSNSLDEAIRKLEKAQGGNGGIPWFPGMPESRYITQYIVAGLGHLQVLGIRHEDARVNRIIDRALQYMDAQMYSDYQEMKNRHGFGPKDDHLGYLEIQYLYARTYFPKQKVRADMVEALDFWLDQSRRFWVQKNLMSQGMIALALNRFDKKETPNAIIASLRERSLHSDEMGMYWKNEGGWFWYQAPIETQALLIEVFDEIANDKNAIEEMKIWLLKQKQVQDWKTTVATAEACYALLRRGSDLLASDKIVEVTMGGVKVDPQREGGKIEAGTGYYKTSWNAGDIKSDMGKITVTKKDDGIAWGAVYWQYFEQLDKITPHKTPLQIEKKLYRQNTTDKGVVLEPITEKNMLHVGDILKVRIEIRVDRDMEYVHMKDMRGAGLDLINQLSMYRWQGSLGYYEAPKDASVNFFCYWLPKGVHVFEYSLRVSHEGAFSNGITTIQSMYAPEFASHTQGVVVKVK